MIKNLKCAVFALCFAISQPIMAQVAVEDSLPKDSMSVVVDSLKQVVSSLSTAVKQNSDENRNRAIWKDRAKYFNISYVSQSLTLKDVDATWKNKMGVAITSGRTYYLHKKPLFNMIKIGIDWSYLDVNFAYYEDKFNYFNALLGGNYYDGNNDGYDYGYNNGYNNGYDNGYDNGYGDDEEDGPIKMYQAEIGMQVGPSITINPISHLKISGYFRFAPSAALLVVDDQFSANYASFFVLGGAVSYKAISVGVEGRWGTAKYNDIFDDDEDEEYSDYNGSNGNSNNNYEDLTPKREPKWKTGATRIYLSFRF